MNKFLITLLILALTACEGIFVLDPIDPRLPKYTESGNDVAGAFVNQDIWKSVVSYSIFGSYYEAVVSSDPIKETLTLRFIGDLIQNEKVVDNFIIQFHLHNYKISTVKELISLKNTKIFLDGTSNYASCYKSHSNITLSNGTGQLYIKNVKYDISKNHYIISGTFGFTIKDESGKDLEFNYGRFDYTIDGI